MDESTIQEISGTVVYTVAKLGVSDYEVTGMTGGQISTDPMCPTARIEREESNERRKSWEGVGI